MTDLTMVSLFAGIGGFDEAARRWGIEPVAAVEIDKQAAGVLRHHFPDLTVFDDVRTVTGDDLRAAGFVPDRGIITGGFPCQPFSVAGRRGGMGGDDDRGNLYWEISRLVAELRPRWVVLENVPGLLSIDSGRTMGTILGDLGRLGYGFAYRVLDAQHFGVAQRRRRVFIVGCAGDPARAAQILLEPEGRAGDSPAGVTARSGTAGAVVAGALTTCVGQLDDADSVNLMVSTLQGGGHARPASGRRVGSRGTPRGDVVNALTAATGGPDDNDPQAGHLVYVKAARSGAPGKDGTLPPESWVDGRVAPTINTFDNGDVRATVLAVLGTRTHALTSEGHDASGDGTGRGTPIVTFHQTQDPITETDMTPALGATSIGMGVHHGDVRRLTPVECERLQGFPDQWTAVRDTDTPQTDSSRYRQLGNAVAVPVAEWIMRRIAEVECPMWGTQRLCPACNGRTVFHSRDEDS